MNNKTYEFDYDEIVTSAGTVAGRIVSYDIVFSDQGPQGPQGPQGIQGPQGSGVTSVIGTAPVVSSGGATPTISISAATTSAAGSMSSADKTKLDGVASGAEVNVNADWNAASGDAQILNKPSNVTTSVDGFMSATDKTKLDAITGTNTGDQTITLTGNVTGSGTGSFAATIANDAVDNAKLANVASQSIKGRATSATGDPEDLTASQVRSILNVADGAEVNVQSNWTEASSGSDAFILNKPTLGTAAAAATTDFAAAVHTHPASAISDSTTAGRALLTAATVQAQRTALDTFVSAANLAAIQALTGNLQRVYIAQDTGKIYAWSGSGSVYNEISPNTHTRAGYNNTSVNDTALASGFLTGPNNTAVGSDALNENTDGGQNTAVGATALQNNTTADYNTAVGFASMSTNAVTGDFNTGVGIQACRDISSGTQNSAFGAGSLRDNQAGSNNTAVGFTSLVQTSGSGNTAVGVQSGDTITSGSNNTIVGATADVDIGVRSRCLLLGFGATSPALNGTLAIGGTGTPMENLTTATAPTGATAYLRVWLNGEEHRILVQKPS